MRRSSWKKALALALASASALGLCACGGGGSKGTSSSADKKFYKAEYLENLPESMSNNSGTSVFEGDVLYYVSSNEDYTQSFVSSYNLVTGETKNIWESAKQSEDDPTHAYEGVNNFAVDKDGNVYLYLYTSRITEESLNADYSNATLDDVINYLVENWGSDENTAAEEWEMYYAESYTNEDGTVDYSRFMTEMASEYESKEILRKTDIAGNTVYEIELTQQDDENIYCAWNGMTADDKGNLYVIYNEWNDSYDKYYVIVYDENGKEKGKTELPDYASGFMDTEDGGIAYTTYGETSMQMVPINPENGTFGEAVDIESESMKPMDEKHGMYNNGTGLYIYDYETKESELYCNWLDCSIASSSVSSFGMLSDGNLAVYIQGWNNRTGEQYADVAIIKEISKEEAGNIKTIDVACMWLDSDVESVIIDFNKKNSDYRITVTQYDDYEDEASYEDMVNKFTTDIASNTDIDVVFFQDYSQVVNMSAKGLLTDMYELLEADEELKKEDFLPNVLTACEQNGKMVILPQRFTLQTVLGKTEDVGAEPGWTMAEMLALQESKGPDTELFYGMTRNEMLNICMSLNYNKFINWENASCDFNNQEFKDMLAFLATLPEEYEYDDEVSQTELLNTGKVLLTSYYMSDWQEIQMYTEIFGGELTYIGYPCQEGNGALISLNSMCGITNSCENKEMAWKFLRELVLPIKDSENEMMYQYGFSPLKSEFDKFCAEAMKEENAGGTWGWDNFEVEIKPATQKQIDDLTALVNGATAVNGAVSQDILNIVREEADAYFSGQKSVEDVAATLQSRMEIYLSETK